MQLNNEEIRRYSRHLILPEVGLAGQKKIKATSVLCIGAGGLGSAVIPALAATMAGSLGFMLPVSTPCNAIVYGSGYIPISRMIRYGFLLDIIGLIAIVAVVQLLVPFVGIAAAAP